MNTQQLKHSSQCKIINKRYIIKTLLGKGGMGDVFLAEDTYRDSHPIAVKTINPLILRDREILEKFKNEYEIMTRLKHPNLIDVFNFGFDEGLSIHYITMEYVRGNTLQYYINNMKLDFDSKIDILIHLLRGIEFIHSRNIIYRDIKPANILIGSNIVKLMDFGLSDIGKVDQERIKGSLLYFAPELFKRNADYRIDIFALGIVFYELITGDNMIEQNSIASIVDILNSEQLYTKMQKKAMECLNDNPLGPIIQKMTSYKKIERYSSCMDIISDINDKLNLAYPYETETTKRSYIINVNFTDREKEFALLKNHIFSYGPSPKLLLISGNIGLGKSILFSQLSKYCEMNDILFFGSDCYKNFNQPFYIIEQFFRQIKYYHKQPPPDIKYFRSLYSSEIIPSSIKDMQSHDKKLDYLHALVNYIIDLIDQSRRISVFYINDLNWIDNASFHILLNLMEIMGKNPKLIEKTAIFASIREDNKTHFKEKLSILNRSDMLLTHYLRPFNLTNSIKYFKNAFGKKNLHRSIQQNIKEINTRIGGNPYFLSEFLKFSIREGIIVRNRDKWELNGNMQNISIPVNIKEILEKRIALFTNNPTQKKLLLIFALVGIPLSMDNIFHFFADSERELVKNHILELELSEIIITKRSPQLTYIAAHSLIREIISEKLSIKNESHLLIAEGLEKAFSEEEDSIIEELAFHYRLTDKYEKSIHYLRKCAKSISKRYYDFKKIIGYYTEALKISKAYLPKDHKINPEIYFDTGDAYFENADHQNALTHFNQAISGLEKSRHNNKLKVKALNKIGLIHLLSNTRKAIKYFEEANSITICDPLENTKKIIYTSINLAGAYVKLDNHVQAESLLMKVYDLGRKHFSLDDPEMHDILYSVAYLYFIKGQYQKSIDHINILINNQKKYGNNSIQLGLLLIYLGSTYNASGNYKESLKTLRKSLKIQKNVYKTSHPKMVTLYNTIGVTYFNMDKHSNALRYLGKALEIAREIYSKKHAAIGEVLLNMSNVYSALNKSKTAMKYALNALDIYKANYGPNNSQTARVYNNIALLHNKNNQFKEGISYLKKSLRINKKLHKENSPIIGINYLNIGVSYHQMKNFDEAIMHYTKATDILVETLGAKHKYLIKNYFNLSMCFYEKKLLTKTLQYLEKGLDGALGSLGMDHVITKEMFTNMVQCLKQIKDPKIKTHYINKYNIIIENDKETNDIS